MPVRRGGMQSALASAIGLPSRSSNALWILAFLMPAEVSSSFMLPLLDDFMEAVYRYRFRVDNVKLTSGCVSRLCDPIRARHIMLSKHQA